jgi:dienelactone hydrolase
MAGPMRVLAAWAVLSSAPAAQPPGEPAPAAGPQRWVVKLAGAEVGHETVTVSVQAERSIVESRGDVRGLGTTSFEQRLEADAATLDCLQYRLQASTARGEQTIEARREESGLRFRVVAGGETHESAASGEAPVLCLDNVVLGHYSLLGRLALGHGGEPFSFTMAVPQVMQALPASFRPGPIVRVRIGEAVREAREGELSVAGVLTRVWYDAADGAPYRVTVPAQSLEAHVADWRGVAEEPGAGGKPATPAAWRESDLDVPSDFGPLPATWTQPAAGAGPWPVVVFLSGSGPNDRDETLGENKPLRDLARGLAASGVASLRFDKRTHVLRQRVLAARAAGAPEEELQALATMGGDMTLRQEYLDDALAAVKLASGREGARADAVFLLGHSLGGLAAAEVAAQSGGLRGLILAAAAGRPCAVLLEEQFARSLRVDGRLSQAEATVRARERIAPLRAILDGAPGAEASFMGAPAGYWRDLCRRDLPRSLGALRLPVLLLQGGKDIQVTVEDFTRLEAALAARPAEALHEARIFPELNHLFMPVAGESTGAEYFAGGAAMDPEAIRTVAEWVRRIAPRP